MKYVKVIITALLLLISNLVYAPPKQYEMVSVYKLNKLNWFKPTSKKERFIYKWYLYYMYAKENHDIKVPFDLVITQRVMEQGYNKCIRHFNIIPTSSHHKFETIYDWQDEVQRDHRIFDNPVDAIIAYDNLMRSKRYNSIFETNSIDSMFHIIASNGYATAPNYENKLKSLYESIRKSRSYQFFNNEKGYLYRRFWKTRPSYIMVEERQRVHLDY